MLRALERVGLADVFGASRVPMLVLNVVYPLVPEEIREFCAGKRAVLVVEEGNPDYIEQAVNVELRRADIQTKVFGKGPLPQAGEYTSDVLLEGLGRLPAGREAARHRRRHAGRKSARADRAQGQGRRRARAAAAAPAGLLHRLPGTPGVLRDQADAARIGADAYQRRHRLPFVRDLRAVLASAIPSSATACRSPAPPRSTPNMDKRPIAIMGDGGFWHNGLITGVASNLFNKGDGVLIVMQNGYASATGQQYIPSSTTSRDGPTPGMDIEQTLRSMGVKWLRTVRTYSVAKMVKTLKEAMRTAERGLKVIIADGECQLARQRRVRAEDAVKLEQGERVTRTRYGVDDEICTGDHSCIRLSGCPSLTVKPSPDPLRTDPVATVIDSCVGCGLCGEVAHAAVLCPSFYRAEIVRNATWRDRALFRLRQTVIGWLGGYNGKVATEGGRMSVDRAPSPLLIAALGGEGGGVLTDWIVSAAAEAGFPVQIDLDPRRRATHRRHHLLHRNFAGAGERAERQAPGAGAHARRRRHRHRGGERIAGGRPHGGERLRHARAHARHRLAQPLLCHGREDRHGRRPLRSGQARSRSSRTMRATRC